MDIETLAPGPDIETLDSTKLDFGNELVTETPEASPKDETPAAEVDKADEPTDEKSEDEEKSEDKSEEKDEQPRDEKGKFAKKDEQRIPKSRFDEAVGKEREAKAAAERRVAELEARLAEQQREAEASVQRDEQVKALDEKIDQLETQRDALLLDGEKDKAAELSRQIRELNRHVARMEAQAESAQVVTAAIEKEKLNLAIAQIERDYPEMNPQSEKFDGDLVQMVLLMQKDLVARRVPPSEALQQAASKIIQRFVDPARKGDEKPTLAAAQTQQAEERKKAAVEKALDTQKRMPATTNVTGLDSDKLGDKGLPSVTTMSVEEYAALPESVRARMRGDVLA